MEIKGTAVLSIRDFVRKNFPDKYGEWLSKMDKPSREIFESSIDSTKWYSAKMAAVAPTETLAKVFFDSDLRKGAWESGRFSAEKALTGIYKIFVKASTPSFIISRAKDIFARYYRPCEMKVTDKGDDYVILNMVNITDPDALLEFRIGGWIEKALEISGCNKVFVDIPLSAARGDDYTKYDIRWE